MLSARSESPVSRLQRFPSPRWAAMGIAKPANHALPAPAARLQNCSGSPPTPDTRPCRARATWTRCVALWQGRIGLPDSPQHVLGSIVGLLAAPRPPALLRLTRPAPPTPSCPPPPPPGRSPPSAAPLLPPFRRFGHRLRPLASKRRPSLRLGADAEPPSPCSPLPPPPLPLPPPPPLMQCAQHCGGRCRHRTGEAGVKVPSPRSQPRQPNTTPAPPRRPPPVAPAEAHTRPHTTTSDPTPPHTHPSAPARHHTWACMKSTYKNRFKQAKGGLNK